MANNQTTRRKFLRASAAGAAALATPTLVLANYRNEPTGPTVKFGFTVPLTGPYAEEGADALRGFRLAVEHLNGLGDGGMLNTLQPLSWRGPGVLGRKVEIAVADTGTNPQKATEGARRLINEGAVMFSGSSSSAVAIALQNVAQESKIVYMCGLTHSNDTTGKDRRRYGFRHFFNAHMTGIALGPVLGNAYGADRRAYHLTADYTWGYTTEQSIRSATEALGWQTVEAVKTPLDTINFKHFLRPILESDADVLVLNHYGRNMIGSLRQAVSLGLRDRLVDGRRMEVVVPLFSKLMAEGVGSAADGIYGASNWHWTLDDPASRAFTRSFGREYGEPPSQAAHTSYAQTLIYADAAARAGSFDPRWLIPELEGHSFDGLGDGPTTYRAEDHQCIKQAFGDARPSGDCVAARALGDRAAGQRRPAQVQPKSIPGRTRADLSTGLGAGAAPRRGPTSSAEITRARLEARADHRAKLRRCASSAERCQFTMRS